MLRANSQGETAMKKHLLILSCAAVLACPMTAQAAFSAGSGEEGTIIHNHSVNTGKGTTQNTGAVINSASQNNSMRRTSRALYGPNGVRSADELSINVRRMDTRPRGNQAPMGQIRGDQGTQDQEYGRLNP